MSPEHQRLLLAQALLSNSSEPATGDGSGWRQVIAETLAGTNTRSTTDVRQTLARTPISSGAVLPLTEYGDRSVRFDPEAGILGDLTRAFTLPRRAMEGGVPAGRLGDEAASFALNVGLAGAPMAKPSGALGIFGGRLAKTADHDALARAEAMAARGADRDSIWAETGWFQGPDQKWRFEIDDSIATVRPTSDWASAADHLAHPALEAAYPGVRDVESLVAITPGVSARANWYADQPPMMTIAAPTPAAAKGAALHEIQHFVQGLEGFPGGSTPELARNTPEFRSSVGSFENEAAARGLVLDDSMRERMMTELSRGIYRRQPGEVEARNVEGRMQMTPAQRRATPPWRTLDVPESEIIGRPGWPR